MNALYEKILSAYDQSTDQKRLNAIYEVSQQIVLAGLADGWFFGSHEGAKRGCVFYSLACSCRMC